MGHVATADDEYVIICLCVYMCMYVYIYVCICNYVSIIYIYIIMYIGFDGNSCIYVGILFWDL